MSTEYMTISIVVFDEELEQFQEVWDLVGSCDEMNPGTVLCPPILHRTPDHPEVFAYGRARFQIRSSNPPEIYPLKSWQALQPFLYRTIDKDGRVVDKKQEWTTLATFLNAALAEGVATLTAELQTTTPSAGGIDGER